VWRDWFRATALSIVAQSEPGENPGAAEVFRLVSKNDFSRAHVARRKRLSFSRRTSTERGYFDHYAPNEFWDLQEDFMIPEAKKDAVTRALREAFGVTEFEDIRMLTAGLTSALVFRIIVRRCPYLLRVIMSSDATPGPGQGDPTHQFACMRKAAEAGIAPRVWYTSSEDRISIVVTNDAEGEAYLQTYFGEAVGEYRRARFYLMSQIVHMFYAVVFMLLGSKGKSIESNAKAPDFRDFHDCIWAGGVSLANDERKLEYAKVHMNQVLQNLRAVRFQEALRIVSMGM